MIIFRAAYFYIMQIKDSRKYGCALLAGGSGSRMGRVNKAELEYGSDTFAGRIEKEISGNGMPCYLSSAEYEQKVPEGWALVRDCVTGADGCYIGPMGGIYSCLCRAEKDGLDGLFFAPCDAPFYNSDAIIKLIKYIGEDDCMVCWRSDDGRLQMTYGWYSVRCLEKMVSDISKGYYKLVCLLDEIQSRVVDAAEAGLDSAVFRNINDREEYRKLKEAE